MIRFANPRKEASESGRHVLVLTDAGAWASFPDFAERYVRQIGAQVVTRVEGPDMHLWEIEYDGCVLRLVYDDFPNGISIEPTDARGRGAIDALYELALSESDPGGL